MPQFTGGPSVRTTPNVEVEFQWVTDVAWLGQVEVFDNPDAAGTQVSAQRSLDSALDPIRSVAHTLVMQVAAPIAPDTGYFFRIRVTDPTGSQPDFFTQPPLPPFFTGESAIGEVFIDVEDTRALVSWTANVVGVGRVDYGTASPDELLVVDHDNITDHSLEITGLSPATAYQFRVSNRHALGGDSLAERTGMFTTLVSDPAGIRLTQPLARPRAIYPEDVATLSVLVRQRGARVPNVLVQFRDLNGTAGGDALSDASGKATIWMQGGAPGLLRVEASSPEAGNRVVIPIVVRRS